MDPIDFEIAIDRPGLTRFRCAQARTLVMTLGEVFAGLASGAAMEEILSELALRRGPAVAPLMIGIVALSVALGVGLGALVYAAVLKRRVMANAAALRLAVEGDCLRISHGVRDRSDRKIHFRVINDYACVQTVAMRRYGIEALEIRLDAIGPQGVIIIPGVVDCLRVRDQLCRIDAQRETG